MNDASARLSLIGLVCVLAACEVAVDADLEASPDGGAPALEALTTRTFAPAADARVVQNSPSRNYGTEWGLMADGSPVYRSYLRFTVSGVTGAVSSARLRLYVTNGTGDGPALYAAATTWSESAITWSSQPGSTGAVIADARSVAANAWLELDVTPLVKGDGAIGLVLISTSSDGFEARSRESDRPPQLVVVADDGGGGDPTDPPVTGNTYHVDPAGNDGADGRTPATAWRTVAKASGAPLAPGDRLLFRRGGVWAGGLIVSRSGTAAAPITIGAYGEGELPVFRGASSAIKLSGPYLTVNDLWADDASWAGFDVTGASVRLERVRATRNVAGVHLRVTAVGGALLRSAVVDNTKMSVNTVGGDDDSGAFGVLLQGDRNEIAFNTISGHDAASYDYGRDGAAVEVYGGQDNHIHHNLAEGNDTFTELGNARSRGNVYAYNVVRASLASGAFLVTRGGASSWGPVLDTRVYKNTVHLTGSSSQGFVCHGGCSRDVLVMRDNVIQAAWKVGYADAPFDDAGGVYYGGQRQFTLGPGSVVADPRFVAPPGDLHVLSTSPAIDTGVALGYAADLDGVPVPQDGNGDGSAVPDRGAYERR